MSLLIGVGNGKFQTAPNIEVGEGAASLVAGDFTGDGRLDLAVADVGSDDISILLGDGDGTFQTPKMIATGASPADLVAGDFAGDGTLDLAVAGLNSSDVDILLGDGKGGFANGQRYTAGIGPQSLVAGKFGEDGRLDLAVANAGSGEISVLLSDGDGTFADPSQLATTPQATPLAVDVNGDGTDDLLVVDAAGDILYRPGRPQQPGSFDPPVIVNPGSPSRGIAWVPDTVQGPVLASINADDDALSLFAWRVVGFIRIGSLPTESIPAQIIAADLDGDGFDDLVVRNAGTAPSRSISTAANRSTAPSRADSRPSAPRRSLPLAWASRMSRPSVPGAMASSTWSSPTSRPARWACSSTRAMGDLPPPSPIAPGPVRLRSFPAARPRSPEWTRRRRSRRGPTPDGPIDLVAINPGSSSLDILDGPGNGQFAYPIDIATQYPGEAVVMADFDGKGADGVAVLTAAGVSVYLPNGKGGLSTPVTYAVGPDSTGLTVADVNHDGNLDLIIGDASGDVLVLLGEGNGTFRPYQADIELAVADLTGNGEQDIIYADQALDRVAVDYGTGNSTVVADQSMGLLEPGTVQVAYLDGPAEPPDLIVADSGSNSVLIYPGLANGQFGPAIGYSVARTRWGSRWPISMATAFPTSWSPMQDRTRSRSCSTPPRTARSRSRRARNWMPVARGRSPYPGQADAAIGSPWC